ncbi:mRNA splicing protein [Ceratobasidium sp. UAMH 11750]|nr:mRNA splicing protein [Ceratobasidium sp. UAMH 11750]
MGKTKANPGNTLALQVDSEGNVRYDAIAQQGHRDGRRIQSQFKDLVPLAHRTDLDDEARSMERPSEEEVQATADRTRAALEKLVHGKIKAAQPKHVPDTVGKSTFVRYTPSQQNGDNMKQRIIKISEVVEDPMEPPRFKHKKIPRGPPRPPPPILRSPPRKATAAEQKEWMIPPCISNWKNNKGFTIPLDKRLAADGRGLQDVHINDNFAKFSESLFIADRHAREEVRQRSLMQQKLVQKEKAAKEEQLREMAQRARAERGGLVAPSAGASSSAAPAKGNMSGLAGYGSGSDSGSDEDEDEDDEGAKLRDQMRREKRHERERELRMNNMGTEQRAKQLARYGLFAATCSWALTLFFVTAKNTATSRRRSHLASPNLPSRRSLCSIPDFSINNPSPTALQTRTLTISMTSPSSTGPPLRRRSTSLAETSPLETIQRLVVERRKESGGHSSRTGLIWARAYSKVQANKRLGRVRLCSRRTRLPQRAPMCSAWAISWMLRSEVKREGWIPMRVVPGRSNSSNEPRMQSNALYNILVGRNHIAVSSPFTQYIYARILL